VNTTTSRFDVTVGPEWVQSVVLSDYPGGPGSPGIPGANGGTPEGPNRSPLALESGRKNRPLGTIAEIAAVLPSPNGGFEALQPVIASEKIEKYRLQSLVRKLLPERRVSHCLRRKIPTKKNVEVRHSVERQTVGLGNLQVCGSAWVCPPCASNISEQKRRDVEQCLTWAVAAGYDVWLASFTVRHGRGDTLQATLTALGAAYRSMVGNWAYKRLVDRFGLVYGLRAAEVTWGERNGWHPHYHVPLIAFPGVNPGRLQSALFDAWLVELRRVGFDATSVRGVDVSKSSNEVNKYVTKMGRGWTTADEVTKGHIKKGRGSDRLSPMDILRKYRDEREPRSAALFREYDAAFYHKHVIQWGRGLRGRAGLGDELADEVLAADATSATDVILARLDDNDWRGIEYFDSIAELLDVARLGQSAPVLKFAAEQRARYEREVAHV
jgi:hypothetical protein